MTDGSLRPLFAPRSVAVVGASATPGKLGHELLRALDGFPGPVHAVNPSAHEICGRLAVPCVAAIDAPPDLVVLAVPPAVSVTALAEAAAAGARAAVVCAGGFAETGAEGAARQRQLLDVAASTGIRVLGPNTSGFLNPPARLRVSFVASGDSVLPGRAAVVAQSGGMCHALAFLASEEQLGVRLAVGLGNAMDIGFVDVLDHLAADEDTAVILLHIEGIGDGRALYDTVARVSEHVPIVASVVGRADVRDFARSHTGNLTDDYELTRAAFAQAGAVVVDSSLELIDAARALAPGRLSAAPDPGVGIVTGQAGPGLAAADAIRGARVAVPSLSATTRARLEALLPALTFQRNPVDTGRPGPDFGAVLTAVATDPSVDVVLCYALHEPEAVDPVAALRAARAASDVVVVFGTGGPSDAVASTRRTLDAEGIALFRSPERAAVGVRALVEDARARARRAAAPVQGGSRRLAIPDPLDEHATKQLLEAAGLRAPNRLVFPSPDAACGAFERLRPPLAVKRAGAGVAHKTELGGVHLDVGDETGLRAAVDALVCAGATQVLVEEMAAPGVDLIVGARRDPTFGPVVVLGLGGVAVEALRAASSRLAPLRRADAVAMVDELPAQPLLDGFRGLPAVDRDELAGAVLTVSGVLLAHEDLTDVEVNPLRATAAGLVALDALALTAPRLRGRP